MNVEIEDLKAIRERVAKLERQNRRLQRGIFAALAALTGLVVMGQARPSRTIVEAQEFVLKDSNGAIRGRLGVLGKEGSELTLGNSNAQPMMSLRVSADSGDLHFYGSRRSGMNLGVNSGNPSISIADAEGQGSAGLTFGKTGPSLRLADGEGFSTVVGTSQIEKPGEGQAQYSSAASVVLYDKNRKILWKAP